MDGLNLPAVHLRNVPQMFHFREVPFGNGDRSLLNLTGPDRAYAAPGGRKGEYPDPIKQAPQLNIRHCPGSPAPSRP